MPDTHEKGWLLANSFKHKAEMVYEEEGKMKKALRYILDFIDRHEDWFIFLLSLVLVWELARLIAHGFFM